MRILPMATWIIAIEASVRHPDRQDAPGDRRRPLLHPRRLTWPLLHDRRSRQPARGGGARRTAGPPRRLSDPPRLNHPRRARLPSLRPSRRPALVPSDQPALRTHVGHRHDKSRLRRMAEWCAPHLTGHPALWVKH